MNTLTLGLGAVTIMDVPATARIVVSRKVDGSLDIKTTEDEQGALQLLDQAMEAIDGQRLPPDSGK